MMPRGGKAKNRSARNTSTSNQSPSSSSPSQQDPSPSPRICAACLSGPFSHKGFRKAVTTSHQHDGELGYSYTTAWEAISQSISNEGCVWCTIVRRARDGLVPEQFPHEDEKEVRVRFQIDTRIQSSLSIFLNGYKAGSYTIYAGQGDSAAKEVGVRLDGFPNESYVDYEKILECVKQCGTTHEHCSTTEETDLPTRVIDCSDPLKPRLVETHRQIRGHFCTLSYAWGGNQHQKTTVSNIDTYVQEGINIPLPQTISDAILVTNKLGIRYLWVDALCIIQDSSEDKDRELAEMANIYRDAYLSLSILSAFRADQGFLPDERGPDILPFYLADKSKPPGCMMLEYNIPRQTPGLGKYETVVMHRPLDRRGWCLQESMLSPRRVTFQPPSVTYRCRSYQDQEISRQLLFAKYPVGRTPHPSDDYMVFNANHNEGGQHAGNMADEEKLKDKWRAILQDYCRRKITVPSDKFVALASMVGVLQTKLNDQYIAGLWKKDLLTELLWEVWPPMGPDETHLPRPHPYRAPSWSWASVDGELSFSYPIPPTDAASYEAEILACEIVPRNTSLPFGEIQEATLTVKVKMHQLMRDGGKCVFIEQKGTRSGSSFLSSSSGWSWTPPRGNCFEPMQANSDNVEDVKGIKFDCLEGTDQDHPMDFYVVVLRAGRKWKAQGDWIHGILVVPVDGKTEQYRRVAKLDLQYDLRWPEWFDDMVPKVITLT